MVSYTATWEFSSAPAVPLYWHCTITDWLPFDIRHSAIRSNTAEKVGKPPLRVYAMSRSDQRRHAEPHQPDLRLQS